MAVLSEEELDELTLKALRAGAAERGTVLNEDDERLDVPLAYDCVRFVLHLRNNTDYFEGPDLNLHYPEPDSTEFYEVLAWNALAYTNEDGGDPKSIFDTPKEPVGE